MQLNSQFLEIVQKFYLGKLVGLAGLQLAVL